MNAILLLMLSVLVANSTGFSSAIPEIEDPSTEQVRQIAKCMLAFHKETLESVTTSLRPDKVLYEFFEHKKGKKYKVSKGSCTLERLKSFSSRLQEDIDEMTTDRDALISVRDQFTKGSITGAEFDEVLESYGIADRGKVASQIEYFISHLPKLATVKSHVDALVAVVMPQSITLENSWSYFDAHKEEYLPGMVVAEIAVFKPQFFAYVGEYYGLE